MSLQAQFTALYRLYYKRNEREAFLRQGKSPVPGLSEAELAQLRAIEPARLRRVVDLHAGDIGLAWYRPRVPATWLALQAVLAVPEAELVQRLAESPGFESRLNDDADARALAAFVADLGPAAHDTPWLADLLRYERLLGCEWDTGPNPRVVEFGYDVGGIREALLQDGLCPTDEKKRTTWLLLYRGKSGVNELSLKRRDAEAIGKLLAGHKPATSDNVSRRLERLLRDIRS